MEKSCPSAAYFSPSAQRFLKFVLSSACCFRIVQEVLPDPNGIRVPPRLDAIKEKYEAKKTDGEPKVKKPRVPKEPKKPKNENDEVCFPAFLNLLLLVTHFLFLFLFLTGFDCFIFTPFSVHSCICCIPPFL